MKGIIFTPTAFKITIIIPKPKQNIKTRDSKHTEAKNLQGNTHTPIQHVYILPSPTY